MLRLQAEALGDGGNGRIVTGVGKQAPGRTWHSAEGILRKMGKL